LLVRARSGDHAALDRLFLRHLRPLQRWASGRLPGWARGLADTDDLVQDTLLHTLKRVGGSSRGRRARFRPICGRR
jgi:RNA polymerase sigma-70 factor (ECF subfamily)